MRITPYIETTQDGSATLRHPALGETYHSLRGAVGESMHVFIRHGLEFAAAHFGDAPGDGGALHIFEVGFGSGLNAWLTLEYARRHGLSVEYTAVEMFPVDTDTALRLGYTDDPLFRAMHDAPWDTPVQITDGFTLCKTEADFTQFVPRGPIDLVFFDAFAPDVQPGLWAPGRFSALHEAMTPGAVLVTYSAKGIVKQNLREAGFEVHRLPGALGKRHMLRCRSHGDNEIAATFSRIRKP